MKKITITYNDLCEAMEKLEIANGSFTDDDLWKALENPESIPEPVDPLEQPEGFFRIDDYNVCKWPLIPNQKLEHITIYRKDKKPIHNWMDIQKIKNKVLGEEAEAIELYPAMSRLVNCDNIYHLWFKPDKSKFDFGMG